MFLKSLTLRGFKSFAEKTVLEFEPGITAVVGPNGSGKSNVVDAIAWVLGEQGPKSLRGGKMEDVIFAGSAKRPPLGRAEVQLTIDNSDGLLPIDYAEVTISRLLYRSGESEYAINGTPCRLLDVQELLSDTGVGRELHTILGQGQLDEVLHGRPEDRRAAIEEAAGVYKHRRRKDKALRKLAGMEQHLVRLTDLVGELRRQLKPLQQQAETARKAEEVAAELREVRLVLRSRELAEARAQAAELERAEAAFAARLAELEREHAEAQAREAALAATLAEQEPAAAQAAATAHRLETVRERLRGTLALADERARHLAQALATGDEGRSVADLEREAGEVAAELAEVTQELERAREASAAAEAERAAARAALDAFDRRAAEAERARAQAGQRRVRLEGEAASLRRSLEQAAAEAERLQARLAALAERGTELATEQEQLRAQLAELERQERALAGRATAAREARDHQRAASEQLAAEERHLERERAAARARREALAQAGRAGGDALGAVQPRVTGVRGLLTDDLEVEPGYEAAVAAALGADAEAIVVDGPGAAEAAAALLREDGVGRAILLYPEGRASRPAGPHPAPGAAEAGPLLEPRAPWLLRHVRATGPAAAVLEPLLGSVLVAEDLEQARTLLARFRNCRVVTRAGELVAPGRLEGGVAPEARALAARRAVEEAAAAEEAAAEALARAAEAAAGARAELERRERDLEAASAALREARGRARGLRDRLTPLAGQLRAVERERSLLAGQLEELAAATERARADLAAVEAQLAEAGEAAGAPAAVPDPAGRAPLAAAAEAAEQAAVTAREAYAAVRERHKLLTGREAALRRQAEAEAEAARRRARLRAQRLEGSRRAGEAARLARAVLARLERSLAGAAKERDRLASAVAATRQELAAVAAQRREAQAALDAHHASGRASESARVEARLRVEELERRLREELATDPDEALAEYLPPPEQLEALPAGDPRRLDTAELRRVAAALERRLALMGRVNPLALEEFKALEERYAFLSSQLQDLKQTRRDLLKVVKAVDERVRQVFSEAFADTQREFQRTFALLFPGGEGRLVLTDPEDLLATGVDVEVKLPGKKVRRLSLLSGGERSLVALAFCFAIFRARPSPFYVLDEVEAALDDVNLQRFLHLLEDVREQAQLLIVTHQRRTMEAADALYGVSMQPGGVTKVVSHKLRQAGPGGGGQARRGAPRAGADGADGERAGEGAGPQDGLAVGGARPAVEVS